MSETPGIGLPGTPTTLFHHALRLHRLTPDKPLPRDGEPYPDEDRRRREPPPKRPGDRRLAGADIARILDGHLADRSADPRALADLIHGLHVPIRYNAHIADAVWGAEAAGCRETGRWLVRHGIDPDGVTVGLALLAVVGTVEDIPKIQTIGLLSCHFGPLAADTLERLPGGADGLIWLAERVAGWGRVYVVEALCRLVDGNPSVRSWLLRRAADDDFLNGYFAGQVARTAVLHKAVAEFADDPELVDHTTLLVHAMTYAEGMGTSLRRYPEAVPVLEAHVRHLGRLGPTPERYFAAATLARYLTEEAPAWSDDAGLKARWDGVGTAYLALADRADCCDVARAGLAAVDGRLRWLADLVHPEAQSAGPPRRQADRQPLRRGAGHAAAPLPVVRLPGVRAGARGPWSP